MQKLDDKDLKTYNLITFTNILSFFQNHSLLKNMKKSIIQKCKLIIIYIEHSL